VFVDAAHCSSRRYQFKDEGEGGIRGGGLRVPPVNVNASPVFPYLAGGVVESP